MKSIPITQSLFDPEAFHDTLVTAVRKTPGAPLSVRGAVVEILKSVLERAHELAEQQLIAEGDGTRCAEALSLAEDEIIRGLDAGACGIHSFHGLLVQVGGTVPRGVTPRLQANSSKFVRGV